MVHFTLARDPGQYRAHSGVGAIPRQASSSRIFWTWAEKSYGFTRSCHWSGMEYFGIFLPVSPWAHPLWLSHLRVYWHWPCHPARSWNLLFHRHVSAMLMVLLGAPSLVGLSGPHWQWALVRQAHTLPPPCQPSQLSIEAGVTWLEEPV